jgi:ElaB/YqjD/DUF883 family membrane-anchored ribosome-binding protein
MANTTQSKQRNTVRPRGNGSSPSTGSSSSRSADRTSGSSSMTSNLKSKYVEPLQEKAMDLKDGVVEAAESVKSELREDWNEAKEKALEATAAARDKAREAGDRVAEVADRSQAAARRAGESILRTVKDNPLPIALAGAGLAWLAINLITASEAPAAGAEEEIPESGSRRALEPIKQAAEGAVTQVKDRVQRLTDDAGKFAALATERGKQLEQTIETTLRENPLALGAAALAVGAVIGSVLPRTRFENEWLGEKRDEIVEKGQELAHAAVSKAEQAAKKVANVARAATEDA